MTTFVLGGVVAGTLTGTAWSHSATGSPSAFARYQLIVPDTNSQYLVDTATGRAWYRFGTGRTSAWEEQGPNVTKPSVTVR